MKTFFSRFLFALALFLLPLAPAKAETWTLPWMESASTPSKTGTLTTITTDTVFINISGSQWASAKVSVTTAGTATAKFLVSYDNGINYYNAPCAKKTSAVTTDPVWTCFSASTTLVTGETWDVVLPGDATNFGVQCAATGTTSTVVVSGGRTYTPGTAIQTKLYETLGTQGASLNTGTLETHGWLQLRIEAFATDLAVPASVFRLYAPDTSNSAASNSGNGIVGYGAAITNFPAKDVFVFGPASPVSAVVAAGEGNIQALGPVPYRILLLNIATASLTPKYIIYASR